MADRQINIHAERLMRAGEAVAETLEKAAKPPTGVFAPPVVSSPADIAANAVMASMQAKISALSAELAPAGPQIQAATAHAASVMTATDEENAARTRAVGAQAQAAPYVSGRGPAHPDIQAVTNRFKEGPDQPPLPPRDPAPPRDASHDPVIHPPAKPPALESKGDDLDVTSPNSGINIGGDGKNHPPFLNGNVNPLFNTEDGTRPIPTGTLAGADGQQFAFYSQPPYMIPGPDGKPVKNPSFVTPNSAIVDLKDPTKIIGHAPVAQTSGIYDKDSNTMFIVGNPGDGQGSTRQLWQSDPVDPNNPKSWANNWHYVGDVMPGSRENQLIALQGGGYMLTGGDETGTVSGVTASTPRGLVDNTHVTTLVANDPRTGLPGAYGPTIVTDHYDAATGTDTIQMRVSQYGDMAKIPPPGSHAEWPYDPSTYTTTFTVGQP